MEKSLAKTLLHKKGVDMKPEFFYFFVHIPLRGTPLYETAKKENLLMDRKATHYFADSDGSYRMNVKQPKDTVKISDENFHKVCVQMRNFQEVNNRLHY